MVSKKAALMVVMVVAMAIVAERSVDAIDLCGMTQTDMDECKPAVTKDSPTNPSKLCCNALEHADFNCLCGYKHSPWLGTLGVDPDLALGLPTKCGVANAPTC
ncbi:unnamed protein product [Microthlaspi erraticum]|uniref:Bifunctional inhibitor/plant lipid transfer protein/seed storage helical domain-containing protein n=1 Tax=Microthlaspi erraticum TaxID=1685480 RepID=A0A6D2L378_9BRAS|nr:unnamed protein product [Microthlaspi erraticum]